MSRARHHAAPGQGELFAHRELFPVRRPNEGVRAVDLSLRIKTAMGQALKACPESAEMVAARIVETTGQKLSGHTLYTYTAPSKSDRQISLIEFVAFVRVTGALWLWDVLVEDDGLVVLQGAEAKLAQLGHLRQQRSQLDQQLRGLERELHEDPVIVARRRPGGRT